MKTNIECKCFEGVESMLKTHYEMHLSKDNRKSQCNDCFDGDHVQCSGGACLCPCPKSLAQKFQAFREKRGNGSGKDYWKGLEDIANEYYHQL